jgi:hypothetical protein
MFYRKGQQFMKRHQTSIANFNLGNYLKNVETTGTIGTTLGIMFNGPSKCDINSIRI